MGDTSPKSRGCGLMNTIFGRRKIASAGSSPVAKDFGKKLPATTTTNNDPKRLRDVSSDGTNFSSSFLVSNKSSQIHHQKPIHVANVNHIRQQQQHYSEKAMSMPSSKVSPTQGYVNQGRHIPTESVGISGELESMINDFQKSSRGNTMLYGNLGNLRQGGGDNNSHYAMNYIISSNEGYSNNNKVEINNDSSRSNKEVRNVSKKDKEGSLCRAVSTRMDPEQLKIMGNEDYKNGNFAEALALYDAAIAIDPNKASYRSNRSAALTALGRILEAVFECREAIRIEPHYHRAHHRLGNLYFRLGETDKALYHYKQAGPEADPDEVAKVKNLQIFMHKCTEAHKLGDCNKVLMETNKAISSGVDSAPHIFALQAEALLKLRRHQDADNIMSKSPNFDVDECTKFFGPIGNANLLATRARVNIAAGRFEDALEVAQRATRLDPNNKEANKVMMKARAVNAARTKGNELFKVSRFSEACVSYGEGLEHDTCNSILLCNRAACRSKLGQFEKALEDCNAALNLRPSYTKARLRRADCNAKLERWEASIQDYEILLRESQEDKEINRSLLEAQAQLNKGRCE